MKILILANNDVGLYRFRKELIFELLKDNDVFMSLPYGKLVEPLKDAGCVFLDTSIDRRGINPIKDYKLYKKYKKFISEINPDLVITYTIKPNIYGGIACRKKKIKYAENITGLGTAFSREGLLKKFVVFLYKIALKKANVVYFENEQNKEVFIANNIVKQEQCCLLNGAGVNLDDFRCLPYPSTREPFRFLFVGRVMKEKGIDELFEAMRKLREDGFDCMLEVLGGCEEDYKDRIKEYSSEGWLVYHGYQQDIVPFILDANCFVLPSWHEGMANTNLECAASGRPVITSNIPGCKEAVIDGETGMLCRPKDALDLSNCMRNMMEKGNHDLAEMGKKGREHMELVFDKRKVVDRTIETLFMSIG